MDPKGVTDIVSQLGELQFRVEVRPSTASTRTARAGASATVWAGATGAWAGSGDVRGDDGRLKAFKKQEVEVSRRRATRRPLPAARPTLPHRARSAAGARAVPADFAVVEEPARSEERFGGEILTNIGRAPDDHGNPAVVLRGQDRVPERLRQWTGENVGLPMAIILNGEYDRRPVIQSPLHDTVIVSRSAAAALLRRGRPLAHESLEDRQKNLIAVAPDGLAQGDRRARVESRRSARRSQARPSAAALLSTSLAFALVLLYMAIFYRAAGMIANVALLLNLVLLVGAMAFLDATLTLPGIAGVVLTLGMAVDANILDLRAHPRGAVRAGRVTARPSPRASTARSRRSSTPTSRRSSRRSSSTCSARAPSRASP